VPPDPWRLRSYPSRDEQREGGEQMKKYSKPVVKTVEKGMIFAAMA
jgi:hypothetical protein